MLKAYWIHFRFLLSDWLSIGGDMIYMYIYSRYSSFFFWTSLAMAFGLLRAIDLHGNGKINKRKKQNEQWPLYIIEESNSFRRYSF